MGRILGSVAALGNSETVLTPINTLTKGPRVLTKSGSTFRRGDEPAPATGRHRKSCHETHNPNRRTSDDDGEPILKQERSLSDPDVLKAEEVAGYKDYSWLTEEVLRDILERNSIEPSAPRGLRQKEKKGASSRIRRSRDQKEAPHDVGSPCTVTLHAFWSGKQYVAPAGSLLKEVLPLEVTSRPKRWTIYVILKEARCQPEGPIASPQINATISYNNGVAHYTSSVNSWEPSWNQSFFFGVNDVKTGRVNIAVYAIRTRGKDTKEGGCIGTCNLNVGTFFVPYGYHAPWDKWEVLLDPNTGQNTTSFIHLVVQLVPEDVESFADLDKETIRILPNKKQYIEQFGTHIKKNKLPSQPVE